MGVRILRRLNDDERGVSMVEFGFVAPVLALMVAGIVDLSMGLSHRFGLQQAVNRSLEMVQANRVQGNATSTGPDYSVLVRETAAAAGVTEDKVTMTRWLECDGVKQGSFDGSCAATADAARYVELRVVKDFVGRMFVKTVPVTVAGAVRIQ